MEKKRIGVLISGGGTNLQALIDACEKDEINGEIAVVLSNKEDAFGLERARRAGIRAEYVKWLGMAPEEYDEKLAAILKDEGVQLVVLAGWLRVLTRHFIEHFNNRIINIHPSLIPSFCGKGYYGEKVHQAVLKAGVKVTGATIHMVDEGTDTGPILFQEAVGVLPEDTVETLQKRVLEVEHRLLVKAVADFCERQEI
ncbi:phosphoribosylglycinamide formyltransferase [Gudongella oleilytica]|uniref:phosphoribosylglycinamide formyltransferase n=1 Tax=Gudongella oleilytica TaxID=1582259 RepID=UPI002A36D4F4|nr:phosphoribosylglycinamide formyltransferase [Gudongella oleilytica]MDY0256740.1 phosphoribosylglycinamide formyltransferase [Gudongella oleilytica]